MPMKESDAMLKTFDRAISIKLVLWAFPVVGLLNSIEGVLTRARFARLMQSDLEAVQRIARQKLPAEVLARIDAEQANQPQIITARARLFKMTTPKAIALALCGFAFNSALIAWVTQAPRSGTPARLFTLLGSFDAFQALNQILLTLALRRYTPGVLTSSGITLPYLFYVFHRLFHGRFVSGRALSWSLGAGALLSLPSALAGLAFGWLFARARTQ
jgi:hypothetical protein